MIVFYYIIICTYIATMIALFIGYQKVLSFKSFKSESHSPQTKFSVIIPFRNEADNLPVLISSISELNYSFLLFEIIFIDDGSEDNSVQLIKDFFNKQQHLEIDFQLISNQHVSNSPKKDAISLAIKIAKHPWIITTDADCILPVNWLNTFDLFIQKNNPNMVVGPVNYQKENNLINSYQQFDNYSLQATTIGSFGFHSPLLSNGANLAYKKEEFKLVDGFSGNDHLASGDDIFLLEKFVHKDTNKIRFVKSVGALVTTKAENSWKDIIKQRIRWASKTSKQKNRASIGLGALVFITNFMILLLIYLSFVYPSYAFHLAIILALKLIIDGFLMNNHARSFNLKFNVYSFLLCEFIYPFITVIVVLGSLFGAYTWKNRTFKK